MSSRDLNSLLGSRICHDLISPIGAIGNGIELLALSGINAAPEIALISESVENAMNANGDAMWGTADEWILTALEVGYRLGLAGIDPVIMNAGALAGAITDVCAERSGVPAQRDAVPSPITRPPGFRRLGGRSSPPLLVGKIPQNVRLFGRAVGSVTLRGGYAEGHRRRSPELVSEHPFVYSQSVNHAEVEQMRRSVAMAPAGALALRREEAMVLLARLRDLERLVDELRARLEALDDSRHHP